MSELSHGVKTAVPKVKRHDWIFYPIVMPLASLGITPNHLSLLRLILTLPIILLTCTHNFKATAIIFLIAAILDAADGSMARLCKQETKIGAILDPTADKVVNFGVWLGFLFYIKTDTYLMLILAIIAIDTCLFGIAAFKFFIRDLLPKIHREHHGELGISDFLLKINVSRTGANRWGKIKMVIQVIVISALLLFDPQTSFRLHDQFAFLPIKLTLLHFSFPLLVACICFGLLSLYGHIKVISFDKETEDSTK